MEKTCTRQATTVEGDGTDAEFLGYAELHSLAMAA